MADVTTEPQAELVGEHLIVPIDEVHPNPWNYNRQAEKMFGKLTESMRKFGFVEPLVTRNRPAGGYEIINGEHRWQAAKVLQMSTVSIFNLGNVEEAKAKQLCIVLNELGGTPDLLRLSDLLRDINTSVVYDDLAAVMPFQPEELKTMLELQTFSYDGLASEDPRPAGQAAEDVEDEEVFGAPAPASGSEVNASAEPDEKRKRVVFLLKPDVAARVIGKLKAMADEFGGVEEALVTCVDAYPRDTEPTE